MQCISRLENLTAYILINPLATRNILLFDSKFEQT